MPAIFTQVRGKKESVNICHKEKDSSLADGRGGRSWDRNQAAFLREGPPSSFCLPLKVRVDSGIRNTSLLPTHLLLRGSGHCIWMDEKVVLSPFSGWKGRQAALMYRTFSSRLVTAFAYAIPIKAVTPIHRQNLRIRNIKKTAQILEQGLQAILKPLSL